MAEYCCREYEKAVDYNDIGYYEPEDDRFNTVKKAGLRARNYRSAYNSLFKK